MIMSSHSVNFLSTTTYCHTRSIASDQMDPDMLASTAGSMVSEVICSKAHINMKHAMAGDALCDHESRGNQRDLFGLFDDSHSLDTEGVLATIGRRPRSSNAQIRQS